MTKRLPVVGIIPARGGSKGMARKNLRTLCGKPLIAWTIDAAIGAGLDSVLVTTDDDEIRDVAARCGANVIARPAELARDDSPIADAVLHAVDTWREGRFAQATVVLLQPTSPLRTAEDVAAGIRLFQEGGGGSVIAVTASPHSPFKDFLLHDGALEPLFGIEHLHVTRQQLPAVYRQTGALYVLRAEDLRRNRSFFVAPARPLLMSLEHSVDVDTPRDLELAEQALRAAGVSFAGASE